MGAQQSSALQQQVLMSEDEGNGDGSAKLVAPAECNFPPASCNAKTAKVSSTKERKPPPTLATGRKRVCRFFLNGGNRGACTFGQKDLCRNLHVTEDLRCVRCLSRLSADLDAQRAHWKQGCLKSLERTELAGDPRKGLCLNFLNGCCSTADAAVLSGDVSAMCPLRHTQRLKEGSHVLVCVLCGQKVARGGARHVAAKAVKEMNHVAECKRYKEMQRDHALSRREEPECVICARPFYGAMAEIPPGKRVDGSTTLFNPLPPPPLRRLVEAEKEEVAKDEAARTVEEATSGFRVYGVFTNCYHAFCLSCTTSLPVGKPGVKKCPTCREFNAYIPVSRHFESRELLKQHVLAELALRRKIPCKSCKYKARRGCPYNHSKLKRVTPAAAK